jgi:hypothetical protein
MKYIQEYIKIKKKTLKNVLNLFRKGKKLVNVVYTRFLLQIISDKCVKKI